jgi:Xaa-Pro dipeptidase
MITRRRFLQQSGLAVVPLTAQTQTTESTRPPMPAAIASLESLRGRAVSITTDERRARLERARALMTAARVDAVVLGGGTSLAYFTGAEWGNSERLMALVLPARGDPFAVVPAFEEERVREQLVAGPLSSIDLRLWQEDEDPWARLAQGLKDHGIGAGRLGIEETLKFVFSDGIRSAAPSLTLVSATPVTAGCRMIKSPHEIALMRLAAEATLECYEAVFKSLRVGMTDQEVEALIALAYARLGVRGTASVQVGAYTALPHGSATPQTVHEGSIIMIDDGCVVEGYQSDITRTFVLGRPTDRMKQVFDIVRQAQTAALKIARPGVPLDAIDAAARDVIAAAGYGPGFRFFTHRLGHGLGMDMHEWPYLVRHNMFGWDQSPTARPGMAFSNEPGVYIRGEFGIRLEDDMVITESGAELLSPQSASLEQPFG